MKVFGLAVIVVGVAFATSIGATGALPLVFHGDWDRTPAGCMDADAVTRLRITDAELRFYEWGGNIRSSRPTVDGSVDVALDWWSVDDTDADDRPVVRQRAGTLALSPDHASLMLTIDGESTAYVRCRGTA